MIEKTVTKKNTVGLINALFDEMDNLINGISTPQMATAKVSIAKAIVATKLLELHVARFVPDSRLLNDRTMKVELGTDEL